MIKSQTLMLFVAGLFAAFLSVSNLQAQPLVTIDTVAVGDPGNVADTTGYGAVADVFAIGKYAVRQLDEQWRDQWREHGDWGLYAGWCDEWDYHRESRGDMVSAERGPVV